MGERDAARVAADAARSRSASEKLVLPIARRLQLPFFQPRGAPGRRMPMVSWFNPWQLVQTGLQAAAGLVVGTRADSRIVQALVAPGAEIHDYTVRYRDTHAGPEALADEPARELVIDYVCDCGEGWNPTYAVAATLAQPRLALTDPAGRSHALARADLLMFGGDMVYPTPSREAYYERLLAPFEAARTDSAANAHHPSPHVFAVPGNHDWYDGLTAFTRLFCSDVGGRRFGAWWTRQKRSYFALALPHGWWLLALDSQLAGDLDIAQIAYFKAVAERMQPGDRVIACLAQPAWVYAHKYRHIDGAHADAPDETDLVFLRDELLAPRGVELAVYLAGDLHHYRRHVEIDPPADRAPVQKITAGGGGAFLHPTHDDDVSILEEASEQPGARPRRFALANAYPDLRTSWRLSWRNLGFLALNPLFGSVPLLLYVTTAWSVSAAVDYTIPTDLGHALTLTFAALRANPGIVLWVLFLTSLFVLGTDTRSTIYRVVGGVTHATAHWIALFFLVIGARWISSGLAAPASVTELAIAAALVGIGAWVVGSCIMGIYLFVSLNVFGRHSNEAFSSLRIQDWKNFLRLHIEPSGDLVIYPIAIDRVPRRWRARGAHEPGEGRFVGEDGTPPRLIEEPVRIGRRAASERLDPRSL